MLQFYVSIIIFGIMLILFAFVWVAYDSKKSKDLLKQLDDKKDDLVTVINDAEQMVEEMNKFSDYIVTQMEIKNEELNNNLKTIEERISNINSNTGLRKEIKETPKEKVKGPASEGKAGYEIPSLNYNTDLIIENHNFENPNNVYTQTNRIYSRVKEKVIPMNGKYKEVVSLARNGVSDTDIAKRLNMGKGEIQLILEMNKIV